MLIASPPLMGVYWGLFSDKTKTKTKAWINSPVVFKLKSFRFLSNDPNHSSFKMLC